MKAEEILKLTFERFGGEYEVSLAPYDVERDIYSLRLTGKTSTKDRFTVAWLLDSKDFEKMEDTPLSEIWGHLRGLLSQNQVEPIIINKK